MAGSLTAGIDRQALLVLVCSTAAPASSNNCPCKERLQDQRTWNSVLRELHGASGTLGANMRRVFGGSSGLRVAQWVPAGV